MRGAGDTSHKHGRDAHRKPGCSGVQPGCHLLLGRPGKTAKNPRSLSLSMWHEGPQELIPVLAHHRSPRRRPLPSTAHLAQGPQLRDMIWEGHRSGVSFTGDTSWKGSRSLQQPQNSLITMSTPPQAALLGKCSHHCPRQATLAAGTHFSHASETEATAYSLSSTFLIPGAHSSLSVLLASPP